MNRCFAFLIVLAAAGGCTTAPVKPSPTSDQVMAAQYRARGGQGAIGGPEAGSITDAYRQQIAKPPQAHQSDVADRSDER
jgi:hypothetical protein